MSKHEYEYVDYKMERFYPLTSAERSHIEYREEIREMEEKKDAEEQWRNAIGYKDHTKIHFGNSKEQEEYCKERQFVIDAENGELEKCMLALNQGVNINANNDRGNALCGSARNNRIEVCKFLIDNYADINLFDVHGQTPIMLAAEYGNIGVCELLLSHGADITAKKVNCISLQDCVTKAHKNELDIYNLFVQHGLCFLQGQPNEIVDPVGEVNDTSSSIWSWCSIM